MNNRILAALFALAVALLIGVAPVKAEAACAHTIYEKVEAKEPTCTQKGWTNYYKCKDCGLASATKDFENPVKWTTFILDKTEHPDEDKDCVCDVCEAKLDHKLTEVPAVAVTCTTDGNYAYKKCETCGKLFWAGSGTEATLEELTIKATGHFPSDAWFSDETSHWHVCKNVWPDVEEKLSEAEHTFEMKSDGNNHWMECTVCGYKKDETAHAWEWKSEGDYSGKHVATCTVCGKVYKAEGDACVDKDGDCDCDYCDALMPHVWDGSTMKWVKAKEATCDDTGVPEHKECTICGTWIRYGGTVITEAEKILPKLEHELKWTADFDEHWQYCVREGCTYTTEKVAHDADAYTSNGNHTHTLNCKTCGGYAANVACSDSNNDCKCDYCGAAMAHNPGADTSKFTRIDEKAATCESAGNLAYYKCNVCGGAYIYDGTPIDPVKEALGHKWKYNGYLGDKHLVQCVNPGCTKRDVMPCEDTNGDCHCDLPVLSDTSKCGKLVHSHKFIHVDRVEPTCGKEGTEEYLMYEGCGKMFDMNEQPIEAPKVLPALEHEWSEDWEAVEGGHTKTCVNCGETQEVQPHVFANGNPHCTLCGAEEELEYHEGKEATCTEPGFKEYWKSKVTGRKYSDAAGTQYIVKVEEIPALGHQFDTSEGGQHVCATCGEKEDHVADPENPCFCKICYHLMPGHEMAYVPTVPATCTEDGTKAYFRCSCGKLYDASSLETAGAEIEKPAIIPAIGHKLSGNLVEDTRLGDHYRYCVHAGCDYEIHSEHDCKAEDPLSGNYHQFVCECGYTRSEIHYDKDGDKKCDECGHDMANTTVTVEQHDSIKVITGDKDKVDNTQSWWKNWWNMLTSSNAGSQTSGNTPAASTTTSGSAAPAESGEKTAATGGSTGAGTGTQSEKPSTGTGSQNITQKPGTETGTQNPGSAPAQNSFRDILFQVWNWLNGLFASK